MRSYKSFIFEKGMRIRSRARVLESICGAMDRDRTDNIHGSLHDAFKSHIAYCREEYNAIGAEYINCLIYINEGRKYNEDGSMASSAPWLDRAYLNYTNNSLFKDFL
jgi:hypothetical protein